MWLARVVLIAVVFVGSQPACSVCVGACKKDQGPVVRGIEPAPDGSIVVTRCHMTTSGRGQTFDQCNASKLPPPPPTTPAPAPAPAGTP